LVCIGILLLSCAAGSIKDFTAKSAQEESIKTALIAFETAWNSHGEAAVLALLDDDFVMWVWRGSTRRIIFRKGTFGFRLRDIFIDWRYMSLGTPHIWIKDDEATAHAGISLDGRTFRSTFRLINRSGNWLILELEF
jgi:hypothetical protein